MYSMITISSMNKKIDGKNQYTVTSLRKAIYQMQREANKIIMDSPDNSLNIKNAKITQGFVNSAPQKQLYESGKGTYKYNDDMFHVGDLSFKNKSELVDIYNNLANFINNDYESPYYRDRLTKQEQKNRRKMAQTLGVNVSEKQYNELLNMWVNYGDMMDRYKYEEVLDMIKIKNKHKVKTPLYILIQDKEKEFREQGLPIEPTKVLSAISNDIGV